MNKVILGILCSLIVFSCKKSNSDNEKTTHNLTIARFGDFNLKSMKIDKTHQYSSGDYEGTITKYTTVEKAVVIDSSSYGEYGYTHTCYLLDQDNGIQKVYQSQWESLNGNHDNFIYVVTEKVFDFKNDPPIQLKRKDTIAEHYMFSKQYPEPLDKTYNQVNIGDKDLKYWNKELSESWIREYNTEY
ncbi:hypothetical protein [Aquimarina rhabdastrellae]